MENIKDTAGVTGTSIFLVRLQEYIMLEFKIFCKVSLFIYLFISIAYSTALVNNKLKQRKKPTRPNLSTVSAFVCSDSEKP
jgi:multisubunit Na+/H+ antiporter MnhE subunit